MKKISQFITWLPIASTFLFVCAENAFILNQQLFPAEKHTEMYFCRAFSRSVRISYNSGIFCYRRKWQHDRRKCQNPLFVQLWYLPQGIGKRFSFFILALSKFISMRQQTSTRAFGWAVSSTTQVSNMFIRTQNLLVKTLHFGCQIDGRRIIPGQRIISDRSPGRWSVSPPTEGKSFRPNRLANRVINRRF